MQFLRIRCRGQIGIPIQTLGYSPFDTYGSVRVCDKRPELISLLSGLHQLSCDNFGSQVHD